MCMKKFYLGALALCMMASCQNEDAAVLDTQHVSEMEITASLDNSVGSRTALQDDGNGGYKVIWTEGDFLSVFYGSSDAHNKFELNTGAGETTATFKSVGSFVFSSDTENGANSFANVGYYPYSASTTVSKNNDTYVINTEIPVNQTYAESSFAQNASPMVAVSNGLDFAFKNVASVLRVPLKGDKEITKATLTALSNMAGAATVTLTETNGNWMPSANVEAGSAMVVLNCTNPVQLNASTATDFFFVLAPGTYAAGMVVKFYASDGTYYSYTTQNEQTFNRSEVKYLEDKIYGTVGTGHSNGTVGVSEANDELANGVENVEVTIANDDNEPTLQLPATTSDNPTNINFTSLPEDKVITIQASTESQGDEAKNVNLTVPQNANGYDFNIDLPNSTVTLNANEGQQATYDEVTAATAENTLIIGQGVTVNKLIVKKGHVRVRGTVSEISRVGNQNGEVTYIIMEQGANIPNNLGEGFKVISAAEWNLRKAIAEGGTVTLSENITLTSPLFVENTVTLNLNGKNITTTGESFYVQGVVSAAICVKENGNLTVIGEGTIDSQNTQDYAVEVRGGELNIEGGKYVGCVTSAYALTGTINISGGEFTVCNDHAYDYAYVLNLLDGNGKNGTASINVTGGKFYKFNPAVNASENPGKDYVQAGYSSVAADDYYVVSEGVKNELSLRKAIAEGGTVTLSEHITLTSPLFVENTVTLNLNGKNITTTGESFYVQGVVSAAICVKENGNLTVIGEGTIDSQNTQDYAVEVRGGELNIEGGKYVGCVTSAYALTGTINISGGEFTVCNDHAYDYAYVLNLLDGNGKNGTASINVTGGKFYKFNPAVNASENPGKDYVQAGYSSVAADDYYVVSEGTENE